MTVMIDDGGRKGAAARVWDHYPVVGYCVEHGEQVLALSILFTGDDNPADIGRFGERMKAVGALRYGCKWHN